MSQTAINPEFEELITAVRDRLGKNAPLRRTLPGGGRLRIDRQLPFLCVYRAPPSRSDAGTYELVTTEAAYLFAESPMEQHEGLAALCRSVSESLQEHFGLFLLLEIWSDDKPGKPLPADSPQPHFQIVAANPDEVPSTIEAFQKALGKIRIRGRRASVEVVQQTSVSPPGLPPIPLICPESGGGCVHLGIVVRPIYHDETESTVFPLVLQRLRQQLAKALRKAIFAFTGHEGTATKHFESLGPSSLVKAARLVDQQLCEVSQSFDFLLQVTPTNSDEAWDQFSENGFRDLPTFHYRPLPYRPSTLKRRLFDIEIERIEDVTLAHLFWQKQEELDRQISALRDIGTPNFLYSSMQLYGEPSADLVELADEILQLAPASAVESTDDYVGANEIAAAAREHLDYYHEQMPDFNARIDVCNHIASGIMVSKDCLMVAESARLRTDRVEALLDHEVGTHLLTYFNGRKQPLRQLYAGLAGYEELQEGLAVFSEYLVGGLSASRLRTLAARVLAVRGVCNGEAFADTYALLHEQHGFAAQPAFRTTLRAYRGGGLTKDAIYLRGLRDLLDYLAQGHDIEPLYIGKIALMHVPFVQELRRRGIVQPPALMPRFWEAEHLQDRLAACRGLTVQNLLEN